MGNFIIVNFYIEYERRSIDLEQLTDQERRDTTIIIIIIIIIIIMMNNNNDTNNTNNNNNDNNTNLFTGIYTSTCNAVINVCPDEMK